MPRSSWPRHRSVGRPGDHVRRLVRLQVLRHELRLDLVRHGDDVDQGDEHAQHPQAGTERRRASDG